MKSIILHAKHISLHSMQCRV